LLLLFIAGLLLAIIFQPAHIMEEHDFVEKGATELEQCYEAHQLSTTSNFGAKNKLLTWYCGGLNYQVEHHIFPSVSHVHYPVISKIVEATAKEYGVPYRTVPTFGEALAMHQRAMKKMASPDTYGSMATA
jgi:linoleoyl-CoA desaturase